MIIDLSDLCQRFFWQAGKLIFRLKAYYDSPSVRRWGSSDMAEKVVVTGMLLEALFQKMAREEAGGFDRSTFFMVDFVQEGLDKARAKYDEFVKMSTIPAPRVEWIQTNLEANRFLPMQRFLSGDYGIQDLKRKISGLKSGLVEKLMGITHPGIAAFLQGGPLSLEVEQALHTELKDAEARVVSELNRAARYLKRKLVPSDFSNPEYQQKQRITQEDYDAISAEDLFFEELDFDKSNLEMNLPFADDMFDEEEEPLVGTEMPLDCIATKKKDGDPFTKYAWQAATKIP